MGFLGFANVYAMRVNLSVAIVAMINSTQSSNDSILDVCPASTPSNSSVPTVSFYDLQVNSLNKLPSQYRPFASKIQYCSFFNIVTCTLSSYKEIDNKKKLLELVFQNFLY